MLPNTFRIIWPSVSEEKIFRNRPIRNKNCLWRPCLVMDQYEMSNHNRGLSIDAFCHLPVSEEKIFRNLPIRNKNCLWRPCLLMDWDEMRNLYRGPSIDASYQVSVHLVLGFQRHISVNQFRYLYRDNCILNTDIYL